MQLQAFMEEADIDAREMLERLRIKALELGIPFDLNLSTVYRHARGRKYPGPDLQDLYRETTAGLVQPNDWLALHKDKNLGLPSKKRAAAEEADAA